VKDRDDVTQRRAYFGVNVQKPLDLKGVWEIFMEYSRRDIIMITAFVLIVIRIVLLCFQDVMPIPW
jgi:hypothetical protein